MTSSLLSTFIYNYNPKNYVQNEELSPNFDPVQSWTYGKRFLAINSGSVPLRSQFFACSLKFLFLTTYQKTRFSRAQPDREIFTQQKSYCGNFENGNFENSRFQRRLKIRYQFRYRFHITLINSKENFHCSNN